MAYDNSGYYSDRSYSGDYFDQNYETSPYDFVPQSDNYEPSIYNLFDYDPTPFITSQNSHYYSSPSFSSPHSITTAYSIFTPTEPKSVQYYHNPNCYQITVSSFTAHHSDRTPPTQLAKSHVHPEFNAPEFDEYDSTPYSGGYDIVLTYGKPIPPSDRTCYNPLGGPNKKKKVRFADEGDKVIKPEKPRLPEPEKVSQIPPEPEKPPPLEPVVICQILPEIPPEPERVSQIPSGYGLEAMDLCDSLFGFWPSHTRYYAERGTECWGCGGGEGMIWCGSDHRNGAAEYLFGSCDPYVERRDGGGSFGQPIHCYERRYRENPLSLAVQVEFDQRLDQQDDDSWSENFGIF